MQIAVTALAVIAGMVFSLACALLIEEWLFGAIFYAAFARQRARRARGTGRPAATSAGAQELS